MSEAPQTPTPAYAQINPFRMNPVDSDDTASIVELRRATRLPDLSADTAAKVGMEKDPRRAEDISPPLTSPEYRKFIARLFHDAFLDTTLTLADLKPYRILTGWRFVREMARHRGFIASDELLIEALQPEYLPPDMYHSESDSNSIKIVNGDTHDRWVHPEVWEKVSRLGEAQHGMFKPSVMILDAMLDAQYVDIVPQHKRPFRLLETITDDDSRSLPTPFYMPGLALLPPGVPYEYTVPGAPEYDAANPEHDPALHAYIALLKEISRHLQMDLGSETNHNLGRYGLKGLYEPTLIRELFPGRAQIMHFEGMMVNEVMDDLCSTSTNKTRDNLYRKYGLQPVETLGLIKMAKAQARAVMEGDVEEDRGIMVMRLEEVARRARETLDIRAEMSAYKMLGVVQGLARVEPENAATDFMNVIRAVSGEKRAFIESDAQSRALP